MQKKTELKKKTPLKATGKKREKQTIPKLRKDADTVFSKYIRLRDCYYSDEGWAGNCITCDRPLIVLTDAGRWNRGSNVGHFISRGNMELRYDEYNCNLQCARCNAWADKEWMQEQYRKGIREKYGDKTLKELKKRAEIVRTLKRDELEQIIQDCKVEIAHMMTYPNNYRK